MKQITEKLHLDASGINLNTVNILDQKVLSSTLSKVIIATTGKMSKEEVAAALAEKLQYQGSVVEGSFRSIPGQDNLSVGFVRASKEIRVLEDTEIRASYRVLSSNILMDNTDKSLWEVRQGAGGKFLTRHGDEDLSALVESATARGPSSNARVRHLSLSKAAPKEIVAFVNDNGEMDYGFCLRTKGTEKCKVFTKASSQTGQPVVVPYDHIVSIVEADLPPLKNNLTAGVDEANQIDYYRQLFFYDPKYLEEVEDMITEDSVA